MMAVFHSLLTPPLPICTRGVAEASGQGCETKVTKPSLECNAGWKQSINTNHTPIAKGIS